MDILLCAITVALAYRLRLEVWEFPAGLQWMSYSLAVAISVPIFIRFGLYRAIFRYVGWDALMAIAKACAIYGACYATVITFIGFPGVPRSIGFLQPILLFVAVSTSRALVRYWLGGHRMLPGGDETRRNVVIYGAGAAGRQLAAGLGNSREMHVVGFIDDDTRIHDSLLLGKPIYSAESMHWIIHTFGVTDVLLAIPSTSRKRRNEIIEGLRGHAVSVRTLPALAELADGRVTMNDLRPLDIEDLLGRDPVPPDMFLMRQCVTGKTIMVTGAGGSIGSEICRQLLEYEPTRLLIFEQSEYNLYAVNQSLTAQAALRELETDIVPLLGSVGDPHRMDTVLRRWCPDTIYHAAAYKHVPLVQANPDEAVRNNIFGTKNIAELAVRHAVRNFVLISTDKAVRPPNVMGATKRIAEMVLQAMAAEQENTRFAMVRFGNVLGSSGSVVPLFRKQIAAGGPVTVTHPEITRYFMTIPEAAQLVIQAGAMSVGGEVFVLDMGQPVRIVDLARRMIDLSGLLVQDERQPDGDIAIRFVGLRPAEKLYEELLIGDNPEPTGHMRIMKARDNFLPLDQLNQHLAAIQRTYDSADDEALLEAIAQLVPEVRPAFAQHADLATH
ncbi:MAG: polysaccharide biosynthesis protein [Sphingopyxis sp.]|uniref:polysaccharide biosynthesis protein n=1 Tax=Sphingopyxis sp. TaxID=1908224 RepID=UPI001A3F2701|nr:nucleoside-diphosphate sugar epimerase/dehydratase [Sphingopyxis sp.]MBL9071715.1 polysaccharide biosynthesis protein [Sphingopyxis sp.]